MKESQNTQFPLKALLIIQTLLLVSYTAFVGTTTVWNFLDAAISSIMPVSWNGQFAMDFNCYLLLSAIWVLWRNKYSIQSLIIAPIAMTIGIIVFAPYLFFF